jgi:hypothetical protein
MSNEPELRARHYAAVDALVRRTTADADWPDRREIAADDLRAERLDLGPAAPSLVSSAHGAFDRMLLTMPAYVFDGDDNPLRAAYSDLLRKLPAEVGFVVAAHESVQDRVAALFVEAGRPEPTIAVMPDDVHFSVWAEDGYVCAVDSETRRTFLLEPFSFPRYGDSLIADAVSERAGVEHTQTPLYFQGGNVLVGDAFWLIGADYPANSLGYVGRVLLPDPDETPEEAVRRLYGRHLDTDRTLAYVGSSIPVPSQTERTFELDGAAWTEVLHMGNRPGTVQPLFHIDMFLSLAGRAPDGRYRVFVGDPGLAARILETDPWPHAMQEVFDDIADQLADAGFAVLRNPLPLVYVDDVASRTRYWYFATANNALVEIDEVRRRVWLPAYGFGAWPELRATDAANVAAWTDLGFEASLLADFHPFAENLGAVHCIKKYLGRREPSGAEPS